MFPKRVVSALVCLMMLQSGCSTPPVRPDHLADPDKSQLGRVGFVVGRYDPQFEFKAQTGGKGEGAAKGMGAGALESGKCGLLFILCLPVGLVVGATMGAVESASAESLANAKSGLQSEISSLGIPKKLRDALTQYVERTGVHAVALPMESGPDTPNSTPDYSAIRGDVDTVLEIGVTELKAETLGKKGLVVGLILGARVRVVSARDGRVLDTFTSSHFVSALKVEEWLARAGAPISEAIETALKEFAENAVDETLLIYHPKNLVASGSPEISQTKIQERPDSGASKSPQQELVPGYALRAVSPPFRNKIYWGDKMKMNWGHLEYFRLPDLQPTFEWEAFPRGYDLKPGSEPGQARNLRYDFRLYEGMGVVYERNGNGMAPLLTASTIPRYEGMGVVYERNGLEASRHQIEDPLQPCIAYRWTARATFELNGTPRATEWIGGYDTIWGPVGPWEWRRGKRTSMMSLLPNLTNYPIVMTPAANGGPCPGVFW